MASRNTFDVNVIFSYNLPSNQNIASKAYIQQCNPDIVIGLKAVKDTFLAVFSRTLKELVDIVIKVANDSKIEIEERNKKQKPNPEMEQYIFDANLKKALESDNTFEEKNVCNEYMNLLFGGKLYFNMLQNPTDMQVFMERSISIADHKALDAWLKFKKAFSNFKEAPRFHANKLAVWETQLKELKKATEIFSDVDDEDMYIATEYLTYVKEINSDICFSSFDRNFISSLNTAKQKLGLNFPTSQLLKA